MLDDLFIWLGWLPDASELAGRPDRDNAVEEVVSYDGHIRWGREQRVGVERMGDCWGEWVLAKPEDGGEVEE